MLMKPVYFWIIHWITFSLLYLRGISHILNFFLRVICMIFSDNNVLYKWTIFYLGIFFRIHPIRPLPHRKPPKFELLLILNSSLSVWSRDMGLVFFCSEFCSLHIKIKYFWKLNFFFFHFFLHFSINLVTCCWIACYLIVLMWRTTFSTK